MKCLNKTDAHARSEKEKAKLLSIALERMVMIRGEVYGLEDETEPDAEVDCGVVIESCQAVCCTYVFALTQEEVKKGLIKFNTERPYYIARDSDGYCPHLDRKSFRCNVHDERPLRCRKYSCK